MKNIYIVLGIWIMLNLAGCVSQGKMFTHFKVANKGYGSLYIYRPDVFLTSALSYKIIDKKTNSVLGTLNNNSYFNRSLLDGNYILKTDTNELKIQIKRNEITCVKSFVDIKHYPMYSTRDFSLDEVDISKCKFEIRKTRKSI